MMRYLKLFAFATLIIILGYTPTLSMNGIAGDSLPARIGSTTNSYNQQIILHAAAAAFSAANQNGAANTHINMVAAGFTHRQGDFLPLYNMNPNSPNNVSCLLVWNEETVILAFKGATAENQRLFVDSLLIRNRLNYNGEIIEVPGGLHPAYWSVYQRVLDKLRQVGPLVRIGKSGKQLIITGHSMGGILANFLAHDLLYSNTQVEAVVTFGAPHVTTASFRSHLQKLASGRTQLISVENLYDSKITSWADIAGFHTTPTYYLNRIGAPVDYAFKNDVHDMKLYFAVAKARSLMQADSQSFPMIDGTGATVWPVAVAGDNSGLRIEFWPQPASGSWWKALKVFDRNGKAYLIEVENGRFLNGAQYLTLSRSLFEDQVRVEFLKAKFLGVHTQVGSQDVIITPGGGNVIKVWW